jgi:hypothetical protein
MTRDFGLVLARIVVGSTVRPGYACAAVAPSMKAEIAISRFRIEFSHKVAAIERLDGLLKMQSKRQPA